jgi:hypothetical protein
MVGVNGAVLYSICGCKKLVNIPPPVNSVTTSQVFSTDQEATEAMDGVYNGMINGGNIYAFKDGITIYCGASSDELSFYTNGNTGNTEFQDNAVLVNNGNVLNVFWEPFYSTIYGCNAVIAGVLANPAISDSVSSELTGEAKFVRALSYFYLVNLFGEVPLVTTTNYLKTDLLAKSPVDSIYNLVISDLQSAQGLLAVDYSFGGNQRIVPNKWAATALLSRVYLYLGDYPDAESQATMVINNTALYSLVSDLKSVFLTNSTEALWQLQQSNQYPPTFNATPEGYQFITFPGSPPYMYMTSALLNSFEDSDNRRSIWVDSTFVSGQNYYFPYKYEDGRSDAADNGTYKEYYMVLRLAEQYLIRAEAEAQQNQLSTAASDLNTIRNRAGLANISDSIAASQTTLLQAVYHERQVELFAEWGNRWLDLKRWGTATQTLLANKGISVSNNALLYPIPANEIQVDPNLVQNSGY